MSCTYVPVYQHRYLYRLLGGALLPTPTNPTITTKTALISAACIFSLPSSSFPYSPASTSRL